MTACERPRKPATTTAISSGIISVQRVHGVLANQTKPMMHKYHKQSGRPAGRRNRDNHRQQTLRRQSLELAYLLDDKRPLAEFLDEHCGWVLTNLVEAKGQHRRRMVQILINKIAPWQTEVECQAFVDRVRTKFEETSIFEVYQDDDGTWDVAMFDSRYAHWRDDLARIAAITELSSRKHERRSCAASFKSSSFRRELPTRPQRP